MMIKKTLSTLILFGLLFPAFGQEDYLPLLDGERKYVQWYTPCDAGGGKVTSLGGDTLIGTTSYRKLYQNSCTGTGVSLDLIGFVRTNDTNSKLWYTVDGSEDYLFMDLDLEVGDEFTYQYPPFTSLEIQVEAVLDIDGRKAVLLEEHIAGCLLGSSQEGDLLFIEGIGPTPGMLPEYGFFLLGCVIKDGETLFDNQELQPFNNYYPCDVDCLDINTSTSHQSSDLSPLFRLTAISTSIVSIENQTNQLDLQIVDVAGRVVNSMDRVYQGAIELDISTLASGIYWLRGTYAPSGQMQVEPFVKVR